jgi:hypothetical protein
MDFKVVMSILVLVLLEKEFCTVLLMMVMFAWLQMNVLYLGIVLGLNTAPFLLVKLLEPVLTKT